jgi:SsrA-binding protein
MVITESKNSLVHEPNRIKKLLLKKTELNKLQNQLVKGMSILVTKVFLNEKGMAKVEIVLGKGKKLYDKRETIKERDLNRKNNFVD